MLDMAKQAQKTVSPQAQRQASEKKRDISPCENGVVGIEKAFKEVFSELQVLPFEKLYPPSLPSLDTPKNDIS